MLFRSSECLSPVPLVSPTYVVLPEEPFEILSRPWELPKLDVYEEHWKLSEEDTKAFIKKNVTPLLCGCAVSEEPWKDEHDGWRSPLFILALNLALILSPEGYEEYLLHRPLSPILTFKAIRETPRPGKCTHTGRRPLTSSDIIRSFDLKPARDLDVQEPSVQTDSVLYALY